MATLMILDDGCLTGRNTMGAIWYYLRIENIQEILEGVSTTNITK